MDAPEGTRGLTVAWLGAFRSRTLLGSGRWRKLARSFVTRTLINPPLRDHLFCCFRWRSENPNLITYVICVAKDVPYRLGRHHIASPSGFALVHASLTTHGANQLL